MKTEPSARTFLLRRESEKEEDGNESTDDGEGEKSEEDENEQRPRSSISGFSGVVPTQITAPAREPRERLNDRMTGDRLMCA